MRSIGRMGPALRGGESGIVSAASGVDCVARMALSNAASGVRERSIAIPPAPADTSPANTRPRRTAAALIGRAEGQFRCRNGPFYREKLLLRQGPRAPVREPAGEARQSTR